MRFINPALVTPRRSCNDMTNRGPERPTRREAKMHHTRAVPPAFTLVEVLIVVAIIVILLAILVPALDRAMYSSSLAKCGTNLKNIATGSTQYAMNNRQQYPKRQNNYYWDALMMK